MDHIVGVFSIIFVLVVTFLIVKKRGAIGVLVCGVLIIAGVLMALGDKFGFDGYLYALIFVILALGSMFLINKNKK